MTSCPTPIRAWAVVPSPTAAAPGHPALFAERTRAEQVAPTMRGSITTLFNVAALLQHLRLVMLEPATGTDAMQYLAACVASAHREALATIRAGALVHEAPDVWWVDMSHGLDDAWPVPAATVRQHITVALFAGLIERRPGHPNQYRITRPTPGATDHA